MNKSNIYIGEERAQRVALMCAGFGGGVSMSVYWFLDVYISLFMANGIQSAFNDSYSKK